MDAFTKQMLANQLAIMEALSQLLPSANPIQTPLELAIEQSATLLLINEMKPVLSRVG